MPDVILVRDVEIPLKIKKHWKNGIRYSISKKQINLTIPVFYSVKMQESEIEKLKEWVHMRIAADESILERFRSKVYQTGDILTVRGQQFLLEMNYTERKTLSGKIEEYTITVNIPDNLSQNKTGTLLPRLLSRLFSAFYLQEIKERVHYLNKKYFREDIGQIRLKYNLSNWGSCSSRKNINLSSRLLLAPDDIIDYVIVHELSHLKEMNHSPEFWKIVENIMPDYRQKEQWLKENGPGLKF